MKKRGQINLVYAISAIIILIGILAFAFISINNLNKRASDTELLNLQRSIEAKVFQQSVKTHGSYVNATFAVPLGVEKICFFDTKINYSLMRNPEMKKFSEEKDRNLFLITKDGFFSYYIENLDIPESRNPLCGKPKNSKINMELFSTGRKVQVEIPAEMQDTKCVTVFENGEPSKKINIVFLGYKFSSLSTFNADINNYINNVLLEYEPYRSHKDKFNFYRVDNEVSSCRITDFIMCDQYELKTIASNCPTDYIVLLADRSKFTDFVNPVRSSAISNIIKINNADKEAVIVHELGHSIGNLADEYVDMSYYSDKNFNVNAYPNCDLSDCKKWLEVVPETECLPGCSLNSYFRPTENSIMRDLDSDSYGPLNIIALTNKLEMTR